MTAREITIAYIGGGSRGWARKLMSDLALCPDLGGQMRLYDIDGAAAERNARYGGRLQEAPGVVSRWHYRAEADLGAALRGADVVVLSIQPGPLTCMRDEIAIAEEYGMFFPVGDTTGAPGLVRGLRSATIYAGFAQAIAEHCPDAWVINYTNPLTICTRTLTRVAPGLRAFGCCHEVHGTRRMLAGLAARALELPEQPPLEEIRVNVYGINHFTWVDRATYQGADLLALLRRHLTEPGVLRTYTQAEVESWGTWFHSADQVKFALFQRFGVLAAAGDRHLVEFLPGFTESPETLFRWGVIRTPVAWRIQRWEQDTRQTEEVLAGRAGLELQPSGEEGVAQIRALFGLGPHVTNVNVENQGQVANLPLGAVVETNALFDRGELRPLSAGSLPAGLQPLVARHVANQELIVEAALARDPELAFQAILGDPTNRLPLDRAWEMFQRLIRASAALLPDWPGLVQKYA
jgi:alpha-galactosidase